MTFQNYSHTAVLVQLSSLDLGEKTLLLPGSGEADISLHFYFSKNIFFKTFYESQFTYIYISYGRMFTICFICPLKPILKINMRLSMQ